MRQILDVKNPTVVRVLVQGTSITSLLSTDLPVENIVISVYLATVEEQATQQKEETDDTKAHR